MFQSANREDYDDHAAQTTGKTDSSQSWADQVGRHTLVGALDLGEAYLYPVGASVGDEGQGNRNSPRIAIARYRIFVPRPASFDSVRANPRLLEMLRNESVD